MEITESVAAHDNDEKAHPHKTVARASLFTSSALACYYRTILSGAAYVWLVFDGISQGRTEFAITTSGREKSEAMCRPLHAASPLQFSEHILQATPLTLHIGPFYSHPLALAAGGKVKQGCTSAITKQMETIIRSPLVLDFDLPDWDHTHFRERELTPACSCWQEPIEEQRRRRFCPACWTLFSVGVQLTSLLLESLYPQCAVLCFFTGGRGYHVHLHLHGNDASLLHTLERNADLRMRWANTLEAFLQGGGITPGKATSSTWMHEFEMALDLILRRPKGLDLIQQVARLTQGLLSGTHWATLPLEERARRMMPPIDAQVTSDMRHLHRMPYSVHSTGYVSVYVPIDEIASFSTRSQPVPRLVGDESQNMNHWHESYEKFVRRIAIFYDSRKKECPVETC